LFAGKCKTKRIKKYAIKGGSPKSRWYKKLYNPREILYISKLEIKTQINEVERKTVKYFCATVPL
jgi:hypothetical protein